MLLASSENGGVGFDHNVVYASAESFTDSLAKKAYLLRADPSDADHLAFLHLDIIHGDADVYLRESFDGGENWQNGVRVNDDPVGNNRMQDLVWADFDSVLAALPLLNVQLLSFSGRPRLDGHLVFQSKGIDSIALQARLAVLAV